MNEQNSEKKQKVTDPFALVTPPTDSEVMQSFTRLAMHWDKVVGVEHSLEVIQAGATRDRLALFLEEANPGMNTHAIISRVTDEQWDCSSSLLVKQAGRFYLSPRGIICFLRFHVPEEEQAAIIGGLPFAVLRRVRSLAQSTAQVGRDEQFEPWKELVLEFFTDLPDRFAKQKELRLYFKQNGVNLPPNALRTILDEMVTERLLVKRARESNIVYALTRDREFLAQLSPWYLSRQNQQYRKNTELIRPSVINSILENIIRNHFSTDTKLNNPTALGEIRGAILKCDLLNRQKFGRFQHDLDLVWAVITLYGENCLGNTDYRKIWQTIGGQIPRFEKIQAARAKKLGINKHAGSPWTNKAVKKMLDNSEKKRKWRKVKGKNQHEKIYRRAFKVLRPEIKQWRQQYLLNLLAELGFDHEPFLGEVNDEVMWVLGQLRSHNLGKEKQGLGAVVYYVLHELYEIGSQNPSYADLRYWKCTQEEVARVTNAVSLTVRNGLEDIDRLFARLPHLLLKHQIQMGALLNIMGFDRKNTHFKLIAKDQHRCDSKIEVAIDDWMFAQDIPHVTIRSAQVGEYYVGTKHRPDWMIGDRLAMVEFFGSEHLRDYSVVMRWKQTPGNAKFRLVSISAEDYKTGRWQEKLREFIPKNPSLIKSLLKSVNYTANPARETPLV